MLRGCFSSSGTGKLHVIEGKMNSPTLLKQVC